MNRPLPIPSITWGSPWSLYAIGDWWHIAPSLLCCSASRGRVSWRDSTTRHPQVKSIVSALLVSNRRCPRLPGLVLYPSTISWPPPWLLSRGILNPAVKRPLIRGD
jgi:hypothetical protein